MKIDTLFSLDDEIYFLMGDKIHTAEVKSIKIDVFEAHSFADEEIDIVYTIYKNPLGSQYSKTFSEDTIFKTKQDLLDSL